MIWKPFFPKKVYFTVDLLNREVRAELRNQRTKMDITNSVKEDIEKLKKVLKEVLKTAEVVYYYDANIYWNRGNGIIGSIGSYVRLFAVLRINKYDLLVKLKEKFSTDYDHVLEVINDDIVVASINVEAQLTRLVNNNTYPARDSEIKVDEKIFLENEHAWHKISKIERKFREYIEQNREELAKISDSEVFSLSSGEIEFVPQIRWD